MILGVGEAAEAGMHSASASTMTATKLPVLLVMTGRDRAIFMPGLLIFSLFSSNALALHW
jgi:hypothetical protein